MKYIFCVSPGRSGTHYLYHVFSCVGSVCAVHEPEHEYPEFAGLRPQLWSLKSKCVADSLRERMVLKSSQISDLLSCSTHKVYAETNPLFSTLWYDAVFKAFAGHDITILILRRNTVEVIKSLLDLGWFNNRDGNDWMVTAYSVNSLVQPLCSEQEATPFELVISYLLNIELYARRIKDLYQARGHRVIELHSNQLFENNEIILELLEQCGLSPDMKKLSAVTEERKNKPPTSKKHFDVPLGVCAQELEQYLRKCHDLGIDVPVLPYH